MKNQFYYLTSHRLQNQPSLSVNRFSWLKSEVQILEDDGSSEFIQQQEYCCEYCNFKSKTNKIVLFADKSKHCICILCFASMSLSEVLLKNMGELVILPEMTQTEINNLFRWFFIIAYAANLIDDKQSWIYSKSKAFQQKVKDISTLKDVENKFRILLLDRGEAQFRRLFDVSIPFKMFFPLALSKIDQNIYNKRDEIFASIKFIPNIEIFKNSELAKILEETDFSLNKIENLYLKLGTP